MKCSIDDCTGDYEQRPISHTVWSHGQIIVFDHVPAEVCDTCGDVLLTPDTMRRLEAILADLPQSVQSVPVFEYS